MRVARLSLLLLAQILGGASCPATPPSLAMPLSGSRRLPVGASAVTLYGTPALYHSPPGVDSTDIDGSARFGALGGQFRHQITKNLLAGIDLGFVVFGPGLAEFFYTEGKLSARYNPNTDKFALHAGVAWLSIDTFASNLGATYSFYGGPEKHIELYLGALASFSVMPKNEDLFPTVYGGGSLGVLSSFDSPFQVGLDLSAVSGRCMQDSCDPFFVRANTFHVRYNFGGKRGRKL